MSAAVVVPPASSSPSASSPNTIPSTSPSSSLSPPESSSSSSSSSPLPSSSSSSSPSSLPSSSSPSLDHHGKKITYDSNGNVITNDPLTGHYEEVEIDDMDFDESLQTYFYQCPCGDKFQITVKELMEGETIAKCPSCSLVVKVIYDPSELFEQEEDSEDEK